jgi:hypothetical protein
MSKGKNGQIVPPTPVAIAELKAAADAVVEQAKAAMAVHVEKLSAAISTGDDAKIRAVADSLTSFDVSADGIREATHTLGAAMIADIAMPVDTSQKALPKSLIRRKMGGAS